MERTNCRSSGGWAVGKVLRGYLTAEVGKPLLGANLYTLAPSQPLDEDNQVSPPSLRPCWVLAVGSLGQHGLVPEMTAVGTWQRGRCRHSEVTPAAAVGEHTLLRFLQTLVFPLHQGASV